MTTSNIIPNLIGVIAYEDPHVPLMRTNADESQTPVLFWNIGGKLLVHPDRREKFDEVCSWIAQRGGVDALTDEARKKFGFGPRRKHFRLDMSPQVEDAIEDLVEAKRRHREWFGKAPLFEMPPIGPKRR
jgi:hypothetical protein